MKNNKKTIKRISGTVMYPLSAGNRAFIRCKEKTIMTSKVVKVLKSRKRYINFETENTIYKLTYENYDAVSSAA